MMVLCWMVKADPEWARAMGQALYRVVVTI
jgi:hypothetical protein